MATPDAGKSIEAAGGRVLEAADKAANRGIDGAQPFLEFRLVRVAGLDLTVGGLLAAVVVVLVAWTISMLVRRALKRYGESHQYANRATLYTLSRLLHYVLLAIGAMIALDVAGIPIGKFAVFAGALGVGLGFGLQAIFSNFVSGLILLFDKSLKVGDFVEIGADLRGTVRDIHIRATRITTNDNIDILVPNSEFVTGRVVNWTHRDVVRRLRVPFGVAYGVDKELVKKAALEAAARVPFTLTMDGARRPQVWLVNFGDSAVEYILAVWLTEEATKRNTAIKAAYLWELDTAFKQYAIQIPFPQRDLNLRSVFGLAGDDAIELLRGMRAVGAQASASPAPPTLNPDERAALAGNDARQDAERPADDIAGESSERPPTNQPPVAPDTARDP